MNKRRIYGRIGVVLAAIGLMAIAATATGCKGRTAENMEPTGETVRVEIPAADVAMDSVVANGEM